MASAVVFVLLLDNLPGFNDVLNKTLLEAKFETKTTLHVSSLLKPCNTIAINAILKSLHTELDQKPKPLLRNDEKKLDDTSGLSAETLQSLATAFDVSISESDHDSYEIPDNYINNDIKSDENCDCKVERRKNDKELINNATKGYPDGAPFLVAIFESLSNVTAQTCAGTLISPHWVLTAASCVNLLGHFYSNVSSKSIYTVVVNATDPLTDGTAYNVTKILLHPDHKRLSPTLVQLANKPDLALMRVEPAVEGAGVRVEGGGVKGRVIVYGWMMVKNGTNNDTMVATTVPARTVDCGAGQQVLCLSSNDTEQFNQLSSGGPIITMQNDKVYVIAVAQTDERSVIGYPLYKHYKWIQKVLESE